MLFVTRAQASIVLENLAERFALELGRQPSRDELAQRAGLPVEVLEQRLAHGYQAKQLMVQHNLRLVYSIANRYAGRGVELSDLVQEGAAGLVRGVEKFDPEKGFKFSTYVHWWIRQAIVRAIGEQSRTVRLPTHVTELLAKVKKASSTLGGRDAPTDLQLGEAVGVPADRVRKLLDASRHVNSMENAGVQQSWKAGPTSTIADSVAATVPPVEEEFDDQCLAEDLNAVLNTLDLRERNVLRMHFGLATTGADGEPMTRSDVGSTYNVSPERVRQIEDLALRKLRNPQRSLTLARHLSRRP